MKLIDIIVFLTLLAVPVLMSGQEPADTLSVPEGYELVDSLLVIPAPRVDTLLSGKNIFHILPSRANGDRADVRVFQSASIVEAMKDSFVENGSRQITGYRVRIFFDNRQTARAESEKMLEDFVKSYPGVPAYRSYVNPYFKITVGDFRTKSEAMRFLREIVGVFPKAFIVKEGIEYPVPDRSHTYDVDTVRILRPIAGGPVSL